MNELQYGLMWLTFLIGFVVKCYGTYLAYKKAWWLGIIAFIVPFFAEIVFIFNFFYPREYIPKQHHKG